MEKKEKKIKRLSIFVKDREFNKFYERIERIKTLDLPLKATFEDDFTTIVIDNSKK